MGNERWKIGAGRQEIGAANRQIRAIFMAKCVGVYWHVWECVEKYSRDREHRVLIGLAIRVGGPMTASFSW